MRLAALGVRRPVAVGMLFLAMLVLGVVSYARIPLEMMPGRFEVRHLWVWLPFPRATPRETLRMVVEPVEEELATVPGLASMRARARAGSAQLDLEFHRSTSMDAAYDAVVDRLERAMAELPPEVDRYRVYRWSPSDEPVMWGGIRFGPATTDEAWVAERIVAKRLERIPGVGGVDTWGVRHREVAVDLRMDDVVRHRANLGVVLPALAGDNFRLPAGRLLDRGRVFYARSLSEWDGVADIAALPIGGGRVLADIADVGWALADDAGVATIEGREGAAIAIRKESDANTVEVTERVRAALQELERDPVVQGAHFVVFFDQGEQIRKSVGALLETAAWGGAFAVAVLLVFLRDPRMTLLIAASMPLSLLWTVAVLQLTGRTLNLLTLMGLMLAVGMVVDNAIVVVEAIYARRSCGAPAPRAAVDGAGEVALAVTLATLTSVVVFLPVVLLSADADFGFFMGEIGMPVVYALGISLLVALLFIPAGTVLVGGRPRGEPAWSAALARRYRRMLRWVLEHRADAGAALVAALLLTVVVPGRSVGCEPEAQVNAGIFAISYQVPRAMSRERRRELVEAVERVVVEHREDWHVRTWRSRLGATSTSGFTVVYLDPEEGAPQVERVMEEARRALPEVPGARISVGWGGGGSGGRRVRVVLRGEDTDALEGVAATVARVLRAVPGVLDVRSELEAEGGEEVRLVVDREAAARHGLSAQTVGRTVSFALRGMSLPPLRPEGREVEVLARFPAEDRAELGRLLDLPVAPGVPLRAVVRVEPGRSTGTITRVDRTTAWPVVVDLEESVPPGEARARVEAALERVAMPQGVGWEVGGGRQRQENDESMRLALLLSVALVFIVMGVLFESLFLPLCVLASIPLAAVGVEWMLWATGASLDVMGGVGLVVLVGVVVNNGIVLVDLVTRLRRRGLDRTEALVEAGARRLRPILMTALTTIFGLLPMALGSASFLGLPYAPLGRVVASGLAAGTVLTLLVVPFLYSVLDDVRASAARWAGWVLRRPGGRAAAPRRPPVLSLMLALLVAGAPATARAEALVLTLDDALRRAAERNPDLLGAEWAVREAEGAALAARGTFDPSLSASLGGTSSVSESTQQYGDVLSDYRALSSQVALSWFAPTGTSATLSWAATSSRFRYEIRETGFVVESDEPWLNERLTATVVQSLLRGHRMAYNLQAVRQADRSRERAELDRLSRRQEVLAGVARAYWELWYRRRIAAIRAEAVRTAEEERRVVAAQVEEGTLAPVELARADAALAQARSALIDAENAERDAADGLLTMLGEEPGTAVELATPPEEPIEMELDAERVVEAALASNPSLAAARLAERLAEEDAADARHALLPELDATASYGLTGYERTLADATAELAGGSLSDWSVGIQLSAPLGNRAARGELRSRRAAVEAARVEREALERDIARQVRAQLRALERARAQVELARANLRYAEAALEADRALRAAGRNIERDVLESIERVDEARAELDKALADWQLALVELRRLRGEL